MSARSVPKSQSRQAWFAAKRYGYGAGMPIAWQGWIALFSLMAVVSLPFYALVFLPVSQPGSSFQPCVLWICLRSSHSAGSVDRAPKGGGAGDGVMRGEASSARKRKALKSPCCVSDVQAGGFLPGCGDIFVISALVAMQPFGGDFQNAVR